MLSVRAELRFMAFLEMIYSRLESSEQLSLGVDNFLQGIADKHEGLLYLLKQRVNQT